MQLNSTENLQLASLRSRALAYLIDDLLMTILIMIVFWENISAVSDDSDAMMNLMKVELVTTLIILKVLYHTFFVWFHDHLFSHHIFQ